MKTIMALEQIASNLDPALVQGAYYALQEKFNIGWAVNQLIAISFPILLFFTGWGSKAYDFLYKHLRVWTLAAFAYFFSIVFAISIAELVIVHNLLAIKAELDGSAMPMLLFFLSAKLPSAVLTSSLVAIAGIVLCYFLRKRNKLTWLWLSILTTGFVSIALMLAPYFSNRQPLGTTPVESKIAALAARVGIPPERIAKENCENGSECPPGHVIGIGPTRLMLLDSRLTSKTPEDQLLQVIAHETKHYLLDNGIKPAALLFVICVAVFLPTQALSFQIISWRKNQNKSIADEPKLVPLVYGLGLAIFILLLPAITTYWRHVEFEADRFGLEFNRDNKALIDIMRADAASNPMLFKYTPVTKYFRATHPEISARIELAETYHPWLSNQPLVYEQYFKD
jgi:STE24 endopeptidase